MQIHAGVGWLQLQQSSDVRMTSMGGAAPYGQSLVLIDRGGDLGGAGWHLPYRDDRQTEAPCLASPAGSWIGQKPTHGRTDGL